MLCSNSKPTAPATGAPTIRGTALVGETLAAHTSDIGDTDGLTNVTFSYQWIRNDGSTDTDIQDATGSSYTLAADDEGQTIRVQVTFTDDAGNGETRTSGSTASVSAKLNQGSVPDTPDQPIGTAVFVGGVDLEWNDVLGADSYAVHLYRNGQWVDLPGDGVEIAFYGAGAIISELDPDSTLWFQVRAKNAHGSSEWSDFSSMASTSQFKLGRRDRPANVPASGAPVINGTAQAGETLTADTAGMEDGNGLDRVQFRVQWVSHDGSADKDIASATDSTYTLAASDEGKTIKVRVAFTDRGGYAESLTSAATATVAAAPNSPATGAPAVTGTAQVGETLTADPTGIADADGLSGATFTYQWIANDGSADTDIQDATDSTYTLVADDEGKTVKVRVSFTDDAGTVETLTSAVAGAVAGAVAAAPSSYITVAVTEDSSDSDNIITNFTVTWSDSDDCSTNYNIYLAVSPSGNEAEISRTHLGSAASGSTQATPAISFRGQPFHPTLELYCGAYDAGSSQNVLVASTELFRWNFIGLKEGTYSSAPLTALTISSGTLSPDFDRGIYSYAAELPSDVEVITLDPAVLTGYQTDFVKNPSGWIFSVCRLSAYCDYYYGDGRTTGIALSDADTNTYGFQVNLDRGENRLGISVNGGSSGPGPPKFYRLTVTVQNSPATVQNTPATGQPTISGTAQVGETLTVDTSGISDVDGLDSVSFSYQWLSSRDTEISGATNDSYALVSADEGKYIKVRVSFTDDAANAESLTSAATATVAAAPNSPATGAPAVTGTAQVGETLTADPTGIADADGLSGATFTYQWIANDGSADTDIQDATDSTYTLVADDEGKTIKVRVSFTDDADNGETLTSMPTAVVAAPAQVDSENEPSELSHLTVVVTEDDSDPDDVVSTFTITWNDAEDCSASYNAYLDGVVGEPIHLGSAASEGEQIAGSLTNVSAEAFGFNVKLHCGTIGSDRLVDRLWIPEYSRSFGTLPISRAYLPKPGTYSTEPGLIALTVSSGTLTPAFHNQTLNYTVPDVPNADGRFTLTTTAKADYYTVAFLPGSYHTFFSVCSYGGQQTSLFYGDDAGNQIYPLTDADANTPGFQMDLDEGENVFYIRVWPNCQTGQLYKLTVTRTANAPANTPATGAPTIGGTARVGQTLTADTTGIADSDGLENATFAYQWLADDTDIADATDSTYTLVAAAEGKTIKVRVSFTDDADNDETLTSAATGEVEALPNRPATGAPTISGTAQVGEALTADTSGIADADGLTNVSYNYQWIPNDGSFDTDNQDAPGSTYTLADSDGGKTIKVEVSFTDDAGNGESLTSAATATVASSNPAAGICDRTEQVQDAILGRLNGVVDDCADVTDSHLAGITIGLRISNDPYDRPALSLKSGDFAGLVNIEVLAIYYHTMDALPEDIFEGLTGLNHIYLVENQLGALPEGVFNGLGSLERLDLRGNQIGTLPEGVFNGLGNLESLDLRGNQIGTLPEDVFNGLGNLKSLDLRGNQIGTLPEGVFNGLGNLESLELFGNRINALPEDVFDGLGNLTYLGLSFNQLSALPDDVFDDLGNLEQLYLFKNQLGTLPEGVFNGLSSLERLNLSYNEIAALPEDVFDGLGNLKSLRLDSNDLASPPEDVFDGLDSLTHLTLSHNRIHTLPEDVFEGLGNLTSLGLGNNQINVLPEDVFDELGNLTSLGLGGNQLGALPEGVFDELGNLTSLDLGNNRIGRLAEDFFDELGNLTSLDLSSNRLGAVPEGFFDELGNLTYLSLYRNQIRALPEDVFEGLGNLTSLNLHTNQISVLPEDVFDGLGNLNKLYLNENQLSALPEDVFDGLSNLNELYLFENQLSALPEDVFDGLSNLNELYLYGNQISALPEDVFDGLSNLNGLYLWGNPGTPFTLTTDLERQGDNAVLVKVAEGVPFDMAVTLSATGGTLSAASVTIKGGTADSEAVTVTRSGDGPVTVSVVSAVFQAGDYNGIQAGLGEPLILGDAEGDNRPATGTPAISGIAQVGETLTADTAGIADADGLTNVTYSYQWIVNDGTADTDIADATDSTYTLVAAAEGKTIKVRVSFTDDADNEETLTSAATGEVEALPNRPATGAPTISGTAQVGEALTADTSGIADDDGLNNVSYSYQWIRNDGSSDTDITDATGSTYPLAAADEGQTIKVKVTFTDDADNEETLTSDATCRSGRCGPHGTARETSQPDGHRQFGWHCDSELGRPQR